jgi:hypothetical protein
MVNIDLPKSFDNWKLQSPYDEGGYPIFFDHCANCKTPLYEGESVLFDSGETYLCDEKCAKEYIIKNVENLSDFIIDELLNKITL